MKNLGKIYCLKEPITNQIRYIGFTRSSLKTRFSQHKHDALKKKKLSHCYNWFRKCVKEQGLPLIVLLEDNIELKDWEIKENFWINSFKNLTNQKSGGNGVHLNTKGSGKVRSINSKKIPIIQLNKQGDFIKEWDSCINAENTLIGKYTGNIYRALKSQSLALGFMWIRKDKYDKSKIYKPKSKVKKPVYVFCIFTKKILKEYESLTQLSKESNEKISYVYRYVHEFKIFKDFYFLSYNKNIKSFPKPELDFNEDIVRTLKETSRWYLM